MRGLGGGAFLWEIEGEKYRERDSRLKREKEKKKNV